MKGTMSKERIYADGVENVSLVEGMVRVDLFHYGMRVEGMTVTPHEVTQQLVLPPAAFLRAFESMQRFVAELERQGVVTRGAAVQEVQPNSSPVVQPKKQWGSSPNFA